MRVQIACVFLVAPLLFGCATVSQQGAPATDQVDAAAFVVTLGNDTLSAESFTRTGDRVEGMFVRRSPRTVVTRYTLHLAPSGLASRYEYNTRLPDGSMLPNGARSVVVTYRADSVTTTVLRDTAVSRTIAARDAYPEVDGTVSFYRLPIAALRASGRDSGQFMGYVAGAAQATAVPVARRDANRWWLYSFGSPIEITTDAAGRIMNVDASRTTFRIQARRLPTMDLMPIAMRFLERERASGPLVALSPRDSSTTRIGDASISVNYSRPSARGRRIWGPNGVLGDTLWRTGANAATRFIVSAPVTIGGQPVEPGNYTLMTLAVPGRYALILSRDNTEVARVPLTARPLTPPVEQFTIRVEPTTERGGILRLQWDTQELTAAIQERR